MRDDTPATTTLLDDTKPKRKLPTWPLYFTFGGTVVLVALMFVISSSDFGDTLLGNVLGPAGGMLATLGLIASLVQAHFAALRPRNKIDRNVAHMVLLFGYLGGLAVIGGYSSSGPRADTQPWQTISNISGLAMFAIILGLIAVGAGWRPTGPDQLLAYHRLPTIDQYMTKHPRKPGRPIACHKCNSYGINNYGLNGKQDDRRMHFCASCGTLLYKTRGLTF